MEIPHVFADAETIDAARFNANFDEIEAKAADKTGDTYTGAITLGSGGSIAAADKVLSRPEIKDYAETVVAHGAMGATETFDCEGGNVHTGTMDANSTFTFSNPPATGKCGSLTLILTNDGTIRTITWPGSVRWHNGTAPTMTGTNNKIDIVSFITTDAGTNWFGTIVGQNF